MAAPSMTQNAYGNLATNVSVAAGATATAITVDATTKFEVQLQFDVLPGATVAATNGLQVSVYRLFGAGPTQDTIALTQFTLGSLVASTHAIQSIALPTGKYAVQAKNLDATNAVSYWLTSSTVDTIA